MNGVKRWLVASVVIAVVGVKAASAASVITFESEAVGPKTQPYTVAGVEFAGIGFSPPGLTPPMEVMTNTLEGGVGNHILKYGQDDSKDGQLGIRFGSPVTSFSLEFGNDDPANFTLGNLSARLIVYLSGVQVGTVVVAANVNDLIDQTISATVAGGFDFAKFEYFTPFSGNHAALTMLVDNITFEPAPVPEPATLVLMGVSLLTAGGWRRRRRGTA